MAHQDEDGEDYAFRGNNQGQDAERERIERFYAGDQIQIDGGPGEHEKYLQQEECDAADKFGDGLAEAFGSGATFERVLLELCDGFDVVLGGVSFGVVRQSVRHFGIRGARGIKA